jgi:hypothetical protein
MGDWKGLIFDDCRFNRIGRHSRVQRDPVCRGRTTLLNSPDFAQHPRLRIGIVFANCPVVTVRGHVKHADVLGGDYCG